MGLALAVGLGVLYGLVHLAFGAADQLFDPSGPLQLHPSARMNLVLIVIVAYTLTTGPFENLATARDLRELTPLLHPDSGAEEMLEREQRPRSPQRGRVAALLGGAAGAAVHLAGATGAWRSELDSADEIVRLLLMIALFALLALRASDTIGVTGLFTKLAHDHLRIDLFDPEPRLLFARRGLRLSMNWFVGSALASLLFLDVDSPLIVAGVLVVTVGFGVLSLVTAMRGVQHAVREAKRAELARTREALANAGRALFDGGSGAERVPALVAYEARLVEVREWPLDTSTVLRFAALAMIAVGSWVGGAVVERLLGAALG